MGEAKEYVVSKIRKLKGRKFKALLGMGDSGNTVAVEGKADYVWIRLKFGSALAPPVEALNRHVPPIHGRLVTVQEREAAGQKGFEVIDWAGITYYHDDTTYEDLPAHGWTHESGPGEGSDPVNLYTRGWAELRVEPTVPCSMQGYVTYGWYLFDVPTWFTGGNTPVITAPPVGQRYDLVYIDSSGTVGIETGIPGAPDFITIPEPPDYTIPLAAIELTGTTGCITDDMILDCRVMPNVKSPILFDDSIQPLAVEAGLPCWPGSASPPARRDHRHRLVEPLILSEDVIIGPRSTLWVGGETDTNPATGLDWTFSVFGTLGGIFLHRDTTGDAFQPFILLQNNTANSGFQMRGLDAGGVRFTDWSAGTEWMRIDSSGNMGIGVADPDTRCEILFAGNQLKLSFDGVDNATFAVDTNGDLTITASGDEIFVADWVRHTSSSYRRYYHLPLAAFDPGASGATWTSAGANNLCGWQLNVNTETLEFQTDVHADWDAVSDLEIEIKFQLLDAGIANDTVDLQLICYYMGVGDVATKSQTLEVATTTDGTQFKMYEAVFTIDHDAGGNVVDVGDSMCFVLNLETDTSEIDNVLIVDASFNYNTTHLGIESGDT